MSTAASAPVAEELRRYGLPFVEVREHQGRTAFACKDFQVGDTVIDEKPFVSWEEADSVDGFNMLPPSAKGLERQEQRKQEQRRQEVRALVNVHAEEKEKVGKQASPKKNQNWSSSRLPAS
ncbi:unnamed protein product [Amoebophrya sp. A25]|nr:unnamed protein product [Amoebophrya sp. A25]|eukprot:GSA25T00005490001.1